MLENNFVIMNILLVCPSVIPARLYGGTERVVWDLGKELVKMKHNVRFLAPKSSYCDFTELSVIDPDKSLNSQIPENTDLVHFHFPVKENISKPYIITIHGNGAAGEEFDLNSVFVSENHANRHNSNSFVHNGLDWTEYKKPDLENNRMFFHFLGNAAWKVKNLKGAIKVCKKAGEKIAVIGGTRINTKMGIKINLSLNAKFFGMLDNENKSQIMNLSKGLVFPVLWNEPFGLAIIESMYYGCPVFGTPYGSLPELINDKCGVLSSKMSEIENAIKNAGDFNKQEISDYAEANYNSKKMALNYLEKYQKVINGEKLNELKPKKSSETDNIFKFE